MSAHRSGGPLREGKLLPRDARHHNRALVLRHLRRSPETSRSDLARSTQLSRITVSELVAALIDEGLVEETGVRTSDGPGKPARLLRIVSGARNVLTCDLSRQEVFHGALADLDGTLLDRMEVPVADAGPDTLVAAVDLVQGLVGRAQVPLLGIGVGVPGIVDEDGAVQRSTNLGWRAVRLGDVLRAETGLPVTVLNDGDAGALAEISCAGASGDVLVVRVGRGLGAGLVLGGELVRGSAFSAGEFGHVRLEDPALTGGGPVRGRTIEQLVQEAAAPAFAGGTLREVFDAQQEVGRRLGVVLAVVVGMLDVAEVVLAGDPRVVTDVTTASMAAEVESRIASDVHHLTARTSGLGAEAVLLGAAGQVLADRAGL
ncbi:ROK family transcriptional regulator [Ruania suaedae]|uniref:ROK family transcriptional regulator n=1 Tax=Ruania suaedae TaxID=2897774 RepID=UPI001E2D3B53|nr:ROK family transcriptional regulator [Ruania suaedae]UFU03571.1 ROK family transcriptional regulator [Ruania suaedae]